MTDPLNPISYEEKVKEPLHHFESMLVKSKPGLVKALDAFRERFGEEMALHEFRITNIVLPIEVKQIIGKTLNYLEFRKRNTVYALENLVGKERDAVKQAFLELGLPTMVHADYIKDREVLRVGDKEIRFALEEDTKKLNYSEFIKKHSSKGLQFLSAQALEKLMQKGSYLYSKK